MLRMRVISQNIVFADNYKMQWTSKLHASNLQTLWITLIKSRSDIEEVNDSKACCHKIILHLSIIIMSNTWESLITHPEAVIVVWWAALFSHNGTWLELQVVDHAVAFAVDCSYVESKLCFWIRACMLAKLEQLALVKHLIIIMINVIILNPIMYLFWFLFKPHSSLLLRS